LIDLEKHGKRKGKTVERRGRKATDLQPYGHDRRVAKEQLEPSLWPKTWPGVFFWGDKLEQNAVRAIRERLLVSKAELARTAGVSPITIDRVEKGMACRMETKRKIIFALGFDLSDKEKVFPEG